MRKVPLVAFDEKQIRQQDTNRYCKPWNCGLASETPAVAKRLGRLLTVLGAEINENIAEGRITDEVYLFKIHLIESLRRDGWRINAKDHGGYSVRSANMKEPTRQQYMDGKVTHAQYYEALAEDAGVCFDDWDQMPRVRVALANGDEHLNNIPLEVWDSFARHYQGSRYIRNVFKAHGGVFSIAGGVCLAKAAARKAARRKS